MFAPVELLITCQKTDLQVPEEGVTMPAIKFYVQIRVKFQSFCGFNANIFPGGWASGASRCGGGWGGGWGVLSRHSLYHSPPF